MKRFYSILIILISSTICLAQTFNVNQTTIDSTASYYTGSYSYFYEYEENMMCVDSNAKISLLSIENYELYLYESVDTGITWSKIQLSPGNDGDYFSAMMTCTDDGRRVIIYGVNNSINYGQNIGTWDCFKFGTYAYVETISGWEKTTLSPPSTASNYGLLPYGIYRHSNGKIYAYLHHYGWNNYGGKIYECIYDPITNIWTSPDNILNDTYNYIDRGTAYFTRVEEDPDGNISLIFRRQKDVSYSGESELTSMTQVSNLWTGINPIVIAPTYNETYWNWDIAEDTTGHFYFMYSTQSGPNGPELILCRDGLTGDTIHPFTSSDTLKSISFIEYAAGEPVFQCYFKHDSGRKLYNYNGQGNFYQIPDPIYNIPDDSVAWKGYDWIMWSMQMQNNLGLKDFSFLAIKEGQGRDSVTNAVLPMPIKFFRLNHVFLSQEAKLLDFSIPNMLSAYIDTVNNEVQVIVPVGTDISSLTPDIVNVSPQASVYPSAGMTVDFTNPVLYTVTAQDTSIKEYYEVTVVDNAVINEELLSGITIYPNPTTGNLYIDSKQTIKIELLTLEGKLLMEFDDILKETIELSEYNKGLYLLRVSRGSSYSVMKIILQ